MIGKTIAFVTTVNDEEDIILCFTDGTHSVIFHSYEGKVRIQQISKSDFKCAGVEHICRVTEDEHISWTFTKYPPVTI